MLRIELSPADLGRIRFAGAPAPLLETALILFELDRRPAPDARQEDVWRRRVATSLPPEARALVGMSRSSLVPIFLDVLTADAHEAIGAVLETAACVHAQNVARIEKLGMSLPTWLRRYADGDRALLHRLDRALHAFHASCLEPQWRAVTSRFHRDIERHNATARDFGLASMLEGLPAGLRLTADSLQSPYPWDRTVRLGGHGLTLMPSAFWTGHPLITWDPLDPTRHVLIYPAYLPLPLPAWSPAAGARHTHDTAIGHAKDGPPPALATLLGATRARILHYLQQPHTTSSIAAHAGISASTATEHTTALRNAGLAESVRRGKSVEHRLTSLGRTLINHSL